MIAKAPIALHICWLLVMFSPFTIPILASVLSLHWSIITISAVIATAGWQYLYMALIRNWRRRIMQSMMRKAAREEDKPFILISRSYDQSNSPEFCTRVAFPVSNVSSIDIPLMEALVYNISEDHPVIVLGDRDLSPDDSANRAIYVTAWPDTPFRAKTIVFNMQTGRMTDSQTVTWEEMFISLARAARFVLVIPALSEGVKREVLLLKEQALGSKVVVYMWPSRGAHPHAAICASAQAWEAIRGSQMQLGLDLPKHHKDGALLRLKDDLTLHSIHQPLPGPSILQFLTSDGKQTPLREVVHIIENYEIAADPGKFGPMWGYVSDS